jgi:hypothetical protein
LLKLPDDPMIIQDLAVVAYASYASPLHALANPPSSGYWPSVYCLQFMAIVALLLLLSCHALLCHVVHDYGAAYAYWHPILACLGV